MRWTMITLLAIWCVLGSITTGAALMGPSVWWNHTDRAEGVVGMPLRGAAETAAIRALLPPGGHDTRWLVQFPARSDDLVLTYVRYQLAHLEYPRRIDVVAGTDAPHPGQYTGVITAPGLVLPLPWRSRGERGGFTLHMADS